MTTPRVRGGWAQIEVWFEHSPEGSSGDLDEATSTLLHGLVEDVSEAAISWADRNAVVPGPHIFGTLATEPDRQEVPMQCEKCGSEDDHEDHPPDTIGAQLRCLRRQGEQLGDQSIVERADAAMEFLAATRDTALRAAGFIPPEILPGTEEATKARMLEEEAMAKLVATTAGESPARQAVILAEVDRRADADARVREETATPIPWARSPRYLALVSVQRDVAAGAL